MALQHSFVRFLLVGGAATALHYGILMALHQGAGVDALLATSLGFALSAIFNFLASYHFTFRSRAHPLTAAWRFALVAGAGLLLNALIFATLTRQFDVHYLAAQVLATGVVLVWNYLGGRHFTFA